MTPLVTCRFAAIVFFLLLPVSRPVAVDDCEGCAPEMRSGPAVANLPNDPNAPNLGDPTTILTPQQGGKIFPGAIQATEPGFAPGFWSLSVTGDPGLGFVPGQGACKPNPEVDADDACVQDISCTFEADDGLKGTKAITLKITSDDPGSGGPNVSSNFGPPLTTPPVPTWEVTFIEGEPIVPLCGGTIAYVVTWNRSVTSRLRWELQFKCTPCE